MRLVAFVLSCASVLLGALGNPLLRGADEDNAHQLSSRSRWPNQLYPRIRLIRYSGCKHNSTSAAELWTHAVQVERCLNFSKEVEKAKKSKKKLLDDLRYDPIVTAADIDRAEHPEDYLNEAIYWQLPPEQTKNLLKPIQRCNITIFSEFDCKDGSRVVKFTDEQSDVCIHAHGGKSVLADCYTAKELEALEEDGRGPPEHWKASGILRYGPKNETYHQAQHLMPPYDVNLDKTYDAESEDWLRTCAGRKATHKELMRDKFRKCGSKPLDSCTDTVFGKIPYSGDYLWAGKC